MDQIFGQALIEFAREFGDGARDRSKRLQELLLPPDAVFQGTSSGVIRDTPARVREYFGSLATLGDQRMATGEHRVQLFGDIAINSGYYTRSGTQDGKPVEGRARFSFVYARRGGRWLIVNHHSSSVP